MADLYLTPAEKYTAALGGFYYGDLPEPGTVYTQLIKDILNGTTPDKEPKNILARFIYSLYISDLGDPYPRYELAKLLYWKLHDIAPTKSGSILTVTIDGKEDYMTINTDLSRLWYKVLFGSKTDVITDFPYIFNTMQNKLSDWELFGNVEVSGTPTPDNPIMPEGTGERTKNLFPQDSLTGRTNVVEDAFNEIASSIAFNNGQYVISMNIATEPTTGIFKLCFTYTDDSQDKSSWITKNTPTITLVSNSAKVVKSISITDYNNFTDITLSNIMLNTGSTAKPYEPYGYKIPISCGGTTTPVYLGEVETTRQIKKLVFDGTENWTLATDNVFRITLNGYLRELGETIAISTHYTCIPNFSSVVGWNNDKEISFLVSSSGNNYMYIRDTSFNLSVDSLKSYLATQYAAGTPVTVWYVLAEPKTAVVNEQLMKIGEYADSLSRAQTGIDIPTVIGQNTLDVLTTVKPSSMRIEYTSADETRSRSKRISLLKSPLKKGLIK